MGLSNNRMHFSVPVTQISPHKDNTVGVFKADSGNYRLQALHPHETSPWYAHKFGEGDSDDESSD
jgi:hypothetical protein